MKKKGLNLSVIILLIIVVLHLFILSRLIFFPYPELFIYSYLTKAGLLPYKQIFDQHFPGLMFFPINLATLGIDAPYEARVLHFILVTLTHFLIFIVAKKMFKSNFWALTANFLYLVWQPFFEGYVLWIDPFIPLFLLPAFYLLLGENKKKTGRPLFWVGSFLGSALLFKQVAFPLIGLVFIYILLTFKKNWTGFLAGLAIPTLLLIGYISKIAIWKDFIFWTFTFNLTTFAEMGRKYPDFASLVKSLPLFGLAIFFWIYSIFRSKTKEAILLGIFLLGSLVFAFARFDFVHLQPALPFAALALVLFLKQLPKKYFVTGLPLYLLASVYLLIPFYRVNVGDRILFFGQFEKQVSEKVMQYARPGEAVFALGTMPHLYQMTNTLPPGRVFVFQFPWFMKVAENRVLSGIISDPPKVVVYDETATTGGLKLIAYMPQIDKFIKENYKTVDRVGSAEIMLKK